MQLCEHLDDLPYASFAELIVCIDYCLDVSTLRIYTLKELLKRRVSHATIINYQFLDLPLVN